MGCYCLCTIFCIIVFHYTEPPALRFVLVLEDDYDTVPRLRLADAANRAQPRTENVLTECRIQESRHTNRSDTLRGDLLMQAENDKS